MSAKNWLKANLSGCLTEANGYEIWSSAKKYAQMFPPDLNCLMSFQLLIN